MHTEFTPQQFEHIYPDGIENHWWHLARSEIVARELLSRHPGEAVLDIGCGRGATLLHLRRRGIECFGVEPADVSPLPGTGDYIHVGLGARGLSEAERDRYRVVTLLDVIEHLADPVEFLEGIAAAYGNLECVVVTVPARQELWTNVDEFNGHYRRYIPRMISELALRLGWVVLRQAYFFRPLYPPMRFFSLTGRPRSTRVSPPRGWALPVHRALARLLLLEHRLPLRNFPGSSLIASFGVPREGDPKGRQPDQRLPRGLA